MERCRAPPCGQEALRTALAGLLPQLRAFARFLSGNVTDADDLVQEALLRTLRAAEEDRVPADALKPWCLGVLRNVFHEQRRARRRERTHQADAAATTAAAPAGQATMSELSRGLAVLPPLLREALLLVGAEGMALEDAARICDVPVGTMKARVSRARRQLAQAIGHPVNGEVLPQR